MLLKLLAFVPLFLLVAEGAAARRGAFNVKSGGAVGAAVLACSVGGCEQGAALLQDGNACFAEGSICKDDEETTSVSFGPDLGFSVSVSIDVPTACKKTGFKLPRCIGTIKHKLDGAGTAKSLLDKECTLTEKQKCDSGLLGTKCFDIGAFGEGGTTGKVIDRVVEAVDGLTPTNVTYDPATGKLCITSDLLVGCVDGEKSPYSCGESYGGEVETCP